MRKIDPWVLLQVRPGDAIATLKAAYKAAMLKAHPDRGGTTEDASDVNQAYSFFMEHLVNERVPHPAHVGLVPQPVQYQPQQRIRFVVIQVGGGTTTSSTTTFPSTCGHWFPFFRQ